MSIEKLTTAAIAAGYVMATPEDETHNTPVARVDDQERSAGATDLLVYTRPDTLLESARQRLVTANAWIAGLLGLPNRGAAA